MYTRIVAHRGASGHAPEHTIAAKCLAYGMGVDYLEQDVVASRDRQLVVLHDPYLDDVTDVATRFPGRHREDGRHYVCDFDLAELRELRLSERRHSETGQPVFPGRFEPALDGLRIVTLQEEIGLVRSLNRTTGRDVGIYPEIKDPYWHSAQGIDLAAAIADAMNRYGYGDTNANAYLQCFSATELRRIEREGLCATPRVWLLDAADVDSTARSSGGWQEVAGFASAVGLPYRTLVEPAGPGRFAATRIADGIRAAGLEIHPYTLRRETAAAEGADFEALIEYLLAELQVDALFCDQPEVALAIRLRGA